MPYQLSHITAGFVAVLVGFTSSVAIVLQAAAAAGATPEQINSWLLALGTAMGITCIGFSWHYRQPILTAWSTPGAALLVTGLSGQSIELATGAFVAAALLIVVTGVTGWFERVMNKLPYELAAAMLAGVLLQFGFKLFLSIETQPWLIVVMFISYLAGKSFWPRFNIPIVLVIAVIISGLKGLLNFSEFNPGLATPVWVTPEFSWQTFISVAVPLFIVTMASQNMPGIAVLKAAGYKPPISKLVTGTGLCTLVLAPLGCFAINLAAITAAICAGKEADPDAENRYKAAICAGIFYLLTGIFGATVVALFAAFPAELVAAIAGLALLGTIGNSLATALSSESAREPALITFLVTASGVSLLDIGSAFWGLLAGGIALFISHQRKVATSRTKKTLT